MTVDVVRTGGCLCGRVRNEVWGEPYVSGLCHCATCRKLTGSAYSATANWQQPQFRVTGEVQTYERRRFSRLFCLFDAPGVSLQLTPRQIIPASDRAGTNLFGKIT